LNVRSPEMLNWRFRRKAVIQVYPADHLLFGHSGL